MIRDRGRMKWTSMMLPEHVKLLRDWAKEDTYEKQKEVDEQHLEHLNEIICEAMEYRKCITITHFRKRNYELVIGYIQHWDSMNQNLHVIDRFQEMHRVQLASIADVQFT